MTVPAPPLLLPLPDPAPLLEPLPLPLLPPLPEPDPHCEAQCALTHEEMFETAEEQLDSCSLGAHCCARLVSSVPFGQMQLR